jgi:hypothetical protein
MGKHAKSIDSQILQRVKSSGRGWVFTASNFLDLGSRDAVDKTLSRQSQGGIIRKGSIYLTQMVKDLKDFGFVLIYFCPIETNNSKDYYNN